MADFNNLLSEELQQERPSRLPDTFGGIVESVLREGELEEATAAESVGQQQLGQGLNDPIARFAIASGDTFEEKQAAFQKLFPEGELRQTTVTNELLFRRSPAEQFGKVDANILDKSETLNDVIDFVGGDLGVIIADIALTRGVGSVLGLMVRLGLGGAGGEALEQGAQTAVGVQRQTLDQQASEVQGSAAASAIGGAVGKAVDVGVIDPFLRGRGIGGVIPEAEQAQRLFKQEGIAQPTAGQLSTSPFVIRTEQQAAAIGEALPLLFREQEKGVAQMLNKRRQSASASNFTAALAEVAKKQRSEALRAVNNPRLPRAQAGKSIQFGFREWDKKQKELVRAAYKAAEEVEPPRFDLRELKQFVQAEQAEQAAKRLDVDPELKSIYQKILGMPDQPVDELILLGNTETRVAPVDVLLARRTELFDLKTPAPGDRVRLPNKQAQALFSKLQETLDSPLNTSAEFRAAYKNAQSIAKGRFDVLEKSFIQRIAKSDEPEELALRFAAPEQVTALKLLKRILPFDRYQAIQDSFKTQLFRSPDDITKTLKSFDSETLNLLLKPNEQRLFRSMGESIDRINEVGIERVVRETETMLETIQTLTTNLTPGQGRRFVSEVRRASPSRKRAARAGMLEFLWRESVEGTRASPKLNRNKLNQAFDKLESSGLAGLLPPGERVQLRQRLDLATMILERSPDVGTSLIGASVAREVGGAVLPGSGAPAKAFHDFFQLIGIGNIMAGNWPIVSPAVRRILIGAGKDVKPGNYAAVMSAILASAAADIERSRQNGQR